MLALLRQAAKTIKGWFENLYLSDTIEFGFGWANFEILVVLHRTNPLRY
jgi:hypothetical protein